MREGHWFTVAFVNLDHDMENRAVVSIERMVNHIISIHIISHHVMPYQSLVATNTHLVTRPWMEAIASSLMYRHKTNLVERRRRRSRLGRSSATIPDTTERERCQQHSEYGSTRATGTKTSPTFRIRRFSERRNYTRSTSAPSTVSTCCIQSTCYQM